MSEMRQEGSGDCVVQAILSQACLCLCVLCPSEAKLIHVAIQQTIVQGCRRGKHKQGDWVTEG